MKKFFLILIVALVAACSSDDNGSGGSFESSLVIDGHAFRPVSGTYRIVPYQQGDLHRHYNFTLKQGSLAVMNFTLYVPFEQEDLNGAYSFGPGESHEQLVSCDFAAEPHFYSIQGTTMTVTELGNSRFRITFQNPVALDGTDFFAERPMSGQVEGKFTFQQN